MRKPWESTPEQRDALWRGRDQGLLAKRLRDSSPPTPGEKIDWEAERALDAAWRSLPAPPSLPSNFAARVLAQTAHAELRSQTERARRGGLPFWLHGLRPWGAATGMVLIAGWLGYAEIRSHSRADLARNLSEASESVAPRDIELLADFEAIRTSGAGAARNESSDVALLRALDQ